jgi:hypothetical protein
MSSEFHITVGVHPQSDLNLAHDLALLKAALLYADKVKLCSATATLLILAAQIPTLNDDQLLEMVREVAKIQGTVEQFDGNLTIYKRLRSKKHRTRQELILYHTQKSHFDRTRKELSGTIEKMAQAAGADGLVTALQSNLVELQPFSDTKTDVMVHEFVAAIGAAILSGESYPLLDDQTGNLIRFAIQEGKIQPSEAQIARGKHVGLSADLLQRLPLFEAASVDEVLDIRRDLAQALIRFRAAIIDYSEHVKSAIWDADFKPEAEQLFHQKVAPAVLEIEEACQANHYFDRYIRKATAQNVVPLANLGVLLSTITGLVDITHAAYGITAGAAVLALNTWQEWRAEQRTIEENQLYFYYGVKKRLE